MLVACTAAVVHRNQSFCFYQQNKSSEVRVKFRQAGNCCKSVFEGAKLVYANKTKDVISLQTLGSQDFCRIANSFINKCKSVIVLLFNSLDVLSSALDKVNLFPKTFSKNSYLDDSGIPLLVFLLDLI